MEGPVRTAGWRELLGAGHLGTLLLVCLGPWLHAADALLITTMMPAIVDDIGGATLVAWNFAIYEVGSIAAGAASGLVAARRGLRRPMAVAAAIFALGCAVAVAAPTMPVLLAGRLAQGVGGGGLVGLCYVAVARLFPGPLMPRAMAAVSLTWGASAFVGPLAGGFFVTWADWRTGFGFFGLQAAALALWIWFGLRSVPEAPAASSARLPWRRLALLALAILGVAFAGIVAAVEWMALSLALGVAALALFARLDGRAGEDRLWPRGALDPRGAAGAAVVMVLAMNVATMGVATYGPILLERIHGTPPLVSGWIVAIVSIAWTVSAVLVAGAPERHDARIIGLGMPIVAVSVALSVHAVPEGPIAFVALAMTLEGLGYGMAWTFILRRGGKLIAPEDADRFAAALPTVARLGYALGASFVGILANRAGFAAAAGPDEMAHVARVIFAGSLPVALLGLAAMLRFVTARA
jgi:MFS family permease